MGCTENDPMEDSAMRHCEEALMYVAYNRTKDAYLCLDKCKKWSLTRNRSLAHVSTMDKLKSITASITRMPYDWEFRPEDAGAKGKTNAQQNRKGIVFGEWKATDEYNGLLAAIQTFSSVVSKDKAVLLASEVARCNAEVIDMEHYIEFSDPDDDGMCETYVRLRDLLRHRRNIKQQLELTNKILDSGVRQLTDGHTFPSPTEYVQKAYTPRGDGSVFTPSNVTENQ